jgi:NAD-dependent deacetylase
VFDSQITTWLQQVTREQGRVVVLTGAGISAESGIPTFRGKEGFWTVGSREYQPQELATWDTFSRDPAMVWSWYLYRATLCGKACPNLAHDALVDLEATLGSRFTLVTQNVDGLHLRGGNSPERTYEIHGNIHFARCSRECNSRKIPLPDQCLEKTKNAPLTAEEAECLHCTGCGEWLRPHVLWFDECYDEPRYRYESALRSAQTADLFLVVGTSGSTSLPIHMGGIAVQQGAIILDINPDENPFSQMAHQVPRGAWIQGSAGAVLPELVSYL